LELLNILLFIFIYILLILTIIHRFEQILYLPGHVSCVWSLDISYDGAFCISGGQDRSLRIWERTEDMVFVEEEKERYLEAQVNKATERDIDDHIIDSTGVASSKNLESVKGGELLMEALDLVEAELDDIKECNIRIENGGSIRRQPNPMLLGLTPYKYMIRCLRQVKAPDLEHALLILPFHYVGRFISMLLELIQQGLELELCTRCAVFLLRCHQAQIISTSSLLQEMLALKQIIRESVGDYRDLLGTNIAGLKYINRLIQSKKRSFGDI
jgi:U3 small nucleolar RNA-associated protein 12